MHTESIVPSLTAKLMFFLPQVSFADLILILYAVNASESWDQLWPSEPYDSESLH